MAAAGAQGDVKVIGGVLSPFVLRPRIALNLKGVEFELLPETFGKKSELLLKSNPVFKKMPVLLHNGKSICESMIIVQYIDNVWTSGPAIMPADPFEYAMHQFWTVYIDDKFYPSIKGLRSESKEVREEAMEQIFVGLKLLEEAFAKLSKGKAFFGGDNIGYLDIALGGNLGWLRACEKLSGVKILDEAKIPLLVGWAESFSNHEAVKKVMPETDQLVDFAKNVLAKFKA